MTSQQILTRRVVLKTIASKFSEGGISFDKLITEGQLWILDALLFRDSNRLQILCSTQYGKSLVVALACLIITCVQKKIVAVVAPSKEKARIIMRYYTDHIGDDKDFYTCLEKNTRLDRLRQEDSKTRIILNGGGGIFVVSTDERNSQKSIESAMGYGAEIVILDEACLINDKNESTIFRMISGKGNDVFYCKIGNPFYVEPPYSHFKASWDSGLYKKIFIDYNQALLEGRYTQDFIDEAMNKPMFNELYACIFPSEDEIDKDGWRKLLLNELILKKIKYLPENERLGTINLGVDVSGGGKDLTTLILRWDNYAKVEFVMNTEDTMLIIPEIERIVEKYNIEWGNVEVDDIGVGHGLRDRLKEKGYRICGVSVGEKCIKEKDQKTYFNVKAQISWLGKNWLERNDTFLEPYEYKKQNVWLQLGWIRYKENSERTMQIESKKDLKKKRGKSPDFADGFLLTFYKKLKGGIITI